MRDISEFVNKIHCGDCLDLMREMPDKSVDAIVTDPPAGIAFMGKEWDKDKGGRDQWIAWMQEVSTECLKVIKPGGHALVWSIPRTSHWTAMAWENAGWEVRDKVVHIFGSGFPKSLDISKAIDKAAEKPQGDIETLKNELIELVKKSGLTLTKLNELCGFEASGYLRKSSTWKSILPPQEKWWKIREVIGCDELLSFQFKKTERHIIGVSPWSNSVHHFEIGANHTERIQLSITAPATDAAKQWNGWGTALKPAHEDWLLFRKPVEGTIAQNVLKYGVGGINIGGCRIGSEKHTYSLKGGENLNALSRLKGNDSDTARGCGAFGVGAKQISIGEKSVSGRFPTNLIHDGSDEVLEIFPDTKSGMMKAGQQRKESLGGGGYHGNMPDEATANGTYGDSGSAARFFYCAKASPDERNMAMSNNKHPTVKSLELMRYLVRLVRQPKNTIVLDPFMGSGTTCIAAREEGCDYIGIEKDQESFETAKQRLGFW